MVHWLMRWWVRSVALAGALDEGVDPGVGAKRLRRFELVCMRSLDF
jgi:hypothetical protein